MITNSDVSAFASRKIRASPVITARTSGWPLPSGCQRVAATKTRSQRSRRTPSGRRLQSSCQFGRLPQCRYDGSVVRRQPCRAILGKGTPPPTRTDQVLANELVLGKDTRLTIAEKCRRAKKCWHRRFTSKVLRKTPSSLPPRSVGVPRSVGKAGTFRLRL